MSSDSSNKFGCPKCGTACLEELTAGLCPRCLLAVAMAEDKPTDTASKAEFTETLDSGSQVGQSEPAIAGLDGGARTFGDYDLVDEIARGGMGVVYRARHQTLGREVALKVILSGQFASANDVRRFQMEAESAANLDHPGIVPIYEIGQHEGHHFFTMKLIEGGSLAERMPDICGDMRSFVRIVAEVAETLDYAHRRGILHRDIKPANILLDSDGNALVTDLGLAKRTEADSDLTGTGAIVGTPAYMPPEQASASKEITTSADVFAVGAILYEGLTGRPPYQGESAVATLMQAAKGEFKVPSEVNRNADRVLELICLKCLSIDPNQRYASAGLLAKDLRSWLAGESVSVRPKSFAAVFSEMVADQLRSAIGAMMIGVIGGLVTGVPAYSGIASRWFGSGESKFDLVQLQQSLPSLSLRNSWWLHPPGWFPTYGFLFGILFSVFLGFLIQRAVRPKDTRQAIAFGLVAGLLMTIVQFAAYGIAAGWQGYALQNADEIQLLAEASLQTEPGRQQAIEKIYETYPGLLKIAPEKRADLLSKAVSTQIMLGSPSIFMACLCVCLGFSLVYCVVATVLANRLARQNLFWLFSIWRYLEVMFLLTCAVSAMVMVVFFTFGMVTNKSGTIGLPWEIPVAMGLLLLATIPGWLMMRWYLRWPSYLICVGVIALVAS